MTFREAHRILRLYPSLSIRDRLIILARLLFCASPIIEVLKQYCPKHGLVMDLGCGYGIISHLLSLLYPETSVVGVDLSSHRIQVAKSSVNHGKKIEFHTGDIRSFQFSRCNAIMVVDILYMLTYQDQKRILTQCYEKLYDDGVLVIKDNSKSPTWKYAYTYIEEIFKTKLGIYGREIREHAARYWDVQDFIKLLSGIGFHATAIPLKSYLPYPGVFYVCRKSTGILDL